MDRTKLRLNLRDCAAPENENPPPGVSTSESTVALAMTSSSPLWYMEPTVRPTDEPISLTEKSLALRLISTQKFKASCCRQDVDSPLEDLQKIWDSKRRSKNGYKDSGGSGENSLKSEKTPGGVWKSWTKHIFHAKIFKSPTVSSN